MQNEDVMPTPFESAQLNLKLFELRRDPVLRQARDWFLLEFHPQSTAEFMAEVSGSHNTWIRMVLGYWEMAASMVSTGAIDSTAFLAAHGEIFGAFSKIQPFLTELRATRGEPGIAEHLEKVVMSAPDAEAILKRRREALRGFYTMRQQKMQAAR
jgi:hypothetical protein